MNKDGYTDRERETDGYTDRHKGDLISLLLFLFKMRIMG
jgi:hypothetical protein